MEHPVINEEKAMENNIHEGAGKQLSNNNADVSSAGVNETAATKKKQNKKVIILSVVTAVVLAVVVTLIAVFSLNESEKSAVENVSFLIYEIEDEITIKSGEEIEEAKNAYEALSFKCRIRVKNYDKLESAMKTYNEMLIERTESSIDSIGQVTLSSYKRIEDAREYYDMLSEELKAEIKNADMLINAEKEYETLLIKNVENNISSIGEVTVSSSVKTKIDMTKKEYDKLSDEQKKRVSNYSVLQDAINEYNKLCVSECISLIDSIGTVTTASESVINNARTLYDSLDNEERKNVTNYAVLEEAEKTLKQQKMSFKIGDKLTNASWEVTLTKAKIAHSVYPNDTSGYYYYYTASESSDMIILQFKVTNKSDYTLLMEDFVGDSFEVEFLGKNVTKSADLYYDDNDGWLRNVYSSTGIGAYDTFYINVCLIVPDTVASSDQPVTVTGTFCGQQKCIKVK